MPTTDTGVRRVADLKLRGPAGSTPVRVRWPNSARAESAPPLVLLLPDAGVGGGVDPADEELGRDLCARVGAVVLCTPWAPQRPGALDRAEAALAWAADHGSELGADPGRLVVAGRGAGAAGAAALALRSRDCGWPRIRRQVLVVDDAHARGRKGDCGDPVAGPDQPAPAIVVGQGCDRCVEWLRATGAEVEQLRGTDELASSLREALS
jgi:acetyl esterase/lipase